MPIDLILKKKLGEFTLDIEATGLRGRIGILGPSGCGKSVTLKCIAGLMTPDYGRVKIGDHLFFDASPGRGNATIIRVNLSPAERKAGYLFQNYALFPTMTVEENILAGVRKRPGQGFLSRTFRKERALRAEALIRRFRLEGLEKRLPRQLSGGQQQRTALARIIANDPEVILLDEPFSAIDQNLKGALQEELLAFLSDYEGQLFMVSHDKDEVYRFSDTVLLLDEGKCVASGLTEEIFSHPQVTRAAELLCCDNIFPAQKQGENAVFCPALGGVFRTDAPVPDGVSHIGIYAHHIRRALPSETVNRFRGQIISVTEHTAFLTYRLSTVDGGGLLWSVLRAPQTGGEAGPSPVDVHIPPAAILPLTG